MSLSDTNEKESRFFNGPTYRSLDNVGISKLAALLFSAIVDGELVSAVKLDTLKATESAKAKLKALGEEDPKVGEDFQVDPLTARLQEIRQLQRRRH